MGTVAQHSACYKELKFSISQSKESFPTVKKFSLPQALKFSTLDCAQLAGKGIIFVPSTQKMIEGIKVQWI